MSQQLEKLKGGAQDDWSTSWSNYANSASLNPAQLMRHRLLIDLIRQQGGPVGLLLDIGSGQGDFLRCAVQARLAQGYIGLEGSDTGVAISRTKVPEARFFQTDLLAPEEAVSSLVKQADVAICSEIGRAHV